MKYIKPRRLFEDVNIPRVPYKINSILNGYLDAALWTNDENEDGVVRNGSIYMFNDDSEFSAKMDILKIIKIINPKLEEEGLFLGLDLDENEFGHNFWLDRIGSGSGFFDNDGEYGTELEDGTQLGTWISNVITDNFSENIDLYSENDEIFFNDSSMKNYD